MIDRVNIAVYNNNVELLWLCFTKYERKVRIVTLFFDYVVDNLQPIAYNIFIESVWLGVAILRLVLVAPTHLGLIARGTFFFYA